MLGLPLLYPRRSVLLGMPLGFLPYCSSDDSRHLGAGGMVRHATILGAVAAAQTPGESQGGIAFGAHIGGFIAGCALITFFKHRHVPLWRRH